MMFVIATLELHNQAIFIFRDVKVRSTVKLTRFHRFFFTETGSVFYALNFPPPVFFTDFFFPG